MRHISQNCHDSATLIIEVAAKVFKGISRISNPPWSEMYLCGTTNLTSPADANSDNRSAMVDEYTATSPKQ